MNVMTKILSSYFQLSRVGNAAVNPPVSEHPWHPTVTPADLPGGVLDQWLLLALALCLWVCLLVTCQQEWNITAQLWEVSQV